MPRKTRAPHPELAQFGRRVRELRELRGLSQDALGIDRSQVSRLESGTRTDPSLSQAVALAEALDVSLDYLALGRERVAGSGGSRQIAQPVTVIVASDPGDVARMIRQLGGDRGSAIRQLGPQTGPDLGDKSRGRK